jgi:hypothetical protein
MEKLNKSVIDNYNFHRKELVYSKSLLNNRIKYIIKCCCDVYNYELRWWYFGTRPNDKSIDLKLKSQSVIVGKSIKNQKRVTEIILNIPTQWIFEDFETELNSNKLKEIIT